MIANNDDFSDTALEVTCNKCFKTYVVFFKADDYNDWIDTKGFIQDLMPYLSASERELLLSGTCGECFDKWTQEYVDKTFG